MQAGFYLRRFLALFLLIIVFRRIFFGFCAWNLKPSAYHPVYGRGDLDCCGVTFGRRKLRPDAARNVARNWSAGLRSGDIGNHASYYVTDVEGAKTKKLTFVQKLTKA